MGNRQQSTWRAQGAIESAIDYDGGLFFFLFSQRKEEEGRQKFSDSKTGNCNLTIIVMCRMVQSMMVTMQ